MRYSPVMYAKAFAAVVADASVKPDEAVHGLAACIKRHGDMGAREKIVRAAHAALVHARGGRLVCIETARALPEHLMRGVKETFDPKDAFEESVRPELVAGVRLVVDGEHEFDGSLKNKLDILFGGKLSKL